MFFFMPNTSGNIIPHNEKESSQHKTAVAEKNKRGTNVEFRMIE
jgi:hypothetical protein